MVESKLIIGFEPIGSWDNKAFREIMKQAKDDSSQIQMYVISESTNTQYITSVKDYLGLDDAYVIYNLDGQLDKLDVVEAKGVMIFLDASNDMVDFINDSTPLINTPGEVSGCQAIHINQSLLDVYKAQLKHYTYLQFWVGEISKNLN